MREKLHLILQKSAKQVRCMKAIESSAIPSLSAFIFCAAVKQLPVVRKSGCKVVLTILQFR